MSDATSVYPLYGLANVLSDGVIITIQLLALFAGAFFVYVWVMGGISGKRVLGAVFVAATLIGQLLLAQTEIKAGRIYETTPQSVGKALKVTESGGGCTPLRIAVQTDTNSFEAREHAEWLQAGQALETRKTQDGLFLCASATECVKARAVQ